MLMKMARHTILDQAIKEAKTYTGYSESVMGELNSGSPEASTAITVNALVKEISKLYHVGEALPEDFLGLHSQF